MQKLPTHNPSLSFIKENWSGNILNEKQQYINLDGPAEKSFAELLKWQTEKNPLKPAKKKQQTTVDVVTNHHITSNREDGVVWLGHASFLFTLSGKHFITKRHYFNWIEYYFLTPQLEDYQSNHRSRLVSTLQY